MKRHTLTFLVVSTVFLAPTQVAGMDSATTSPNVSTSTAKDFFQNNNSEPCTFGKLNSPLTIIDAVERALCHHPKSRQAWASIKAQEALVGINKAPYFPSLTANITGSKTRSNSALQGNASFGTDIQATGRASTINLSYMLYDFGLRGANLEYAKRLLVAAEATHDAVLQTIFLETVNSFYRVLAAKASLAAAHEAEKSAKESFLAAEAHHQVGTGTQTDKLQAKTALSQAVLNRVKADGELKTATGSLLLTIGLSVDTPITLENNSDSLPDTGFVQAINELINEAKKNHPQLIAAKSEFEAAHFQIKAARKKGMPTIAVSANYENIAQFAETLPSTAERSSTLAITLDVPLFEGFSSSHRIRSAQAQAEKKEAELINLQQKISLDVWRSYQDLITYTEGLSASDDLLESAEQSYQVASGRYKAGVGNIVELLNSQSSLASAEQQRINALLDWRTARLTLVASLGKLGFWAIN